MHPLAASVDTFASVVVVSAIFPVDCSDSITEERSNASFDVDSLAPNRNPEEDTPNVFSFEDRREALEDDPLASSLAAACALKTNSPEETSLQFKDLVLMATIV